MSKDKIDNKKISPLRPDQYFGLAVHKYNMLSAITPGSMGVKELQNPKFWDLVSRQLRSGDEIRCLAEDNSYVARMVVVYVNGSDVRIRCESFVELEEVKMEAYEAAEDYLVKNGGATGWYVQKKSTGERVLKGFATQAEAFTQLAEYQKKIAA